MNPQKPGRNQCGSRESGQGRTRHVPPKRWVEKVAFQALHALHTSRACPPHGTVITTEAAVHRWRHKRPRWRRSQPRPVMNLLWYGTETVATDAPKKKKKANKEKGRAKRKFHTVFYRNATNKQKSKKKANTPHPGARKGGNKYLRVS